MTPIHDDGSRSTLPSNDRNDSTEEVNAVVAYTDADKLVAPLDDGDEDCHANCASITVVLHDDGPLVVVGEEGEAGEEPLQLR